MRDYLFVIPIIAGRSPALQDAQNPYSRFSILPSYCCPFYEPYFHLIAYTAVLHDVGCGRARTAEEISNRTDGGRSTKDRIVTGARTDGGRGRDLGNTRKRTLQLQIFPRS